MDYPYRGFLLFDFGSCFFVGRRTFALVVPVIVLISSFLVWNFFNAPISPVALFGTSELLPVLKFGLMFLMGSALWRYKSVVPFKGGIAASCLALIAIGANYGCGNLALFVSLPYLLLYLAYRRPVFVKGMRRLGDLSYGTYLFAFPIQQSLVFMSNKSINGWWLAVVTTVISMGLAWLSWRFIEKPAMKLKKRKLGASVAFEGVSVSK
ncbi:acyltransferase family protein [Pseudomonas lini]